MRALVQRVSSASVIAWSTTIVVVAGTVDEALA